MGHAPRLVEGLVLVGLVAIALGGCGTQSAPGDERPVATESASEKQLRRDVNAFDKVTLDFVSPSQETTRSDSTIHGQRLADVLTKAGIPSLPPDAEVYVAEVTTETSGRNSILTRRNPPRSGLPSTTTSPGSSGTTMCGRCCSDLPTRTTSPSSTPTPAPS